MSEKKKRTHVHLDLDSINIIKIDIDKIVFGLFKYAKDKGMGPPYLFTANTKVQDNGYLGVLKNNNVRLIDEPLEKSTVDILFDSSWKEVAKNQLMLITNIPVFSVSNESRACIYIDWDNVQVSLEFIESFIKGAKTFIHNTKVHNHYTVYAFLHNKISKNVKEELKNHNVNIITIIKDKSKSGDEEMLRFIRRNTTPGDSVCVASGDRDFSSLMVEYVRNAYNVFLIYNKQALYTFKHNKHWLSSIDVKDIEGVGTKQQSDSSSKKVYKTKPCKFYNLDVCNAINCNFLHICGFCGRPHKMRDFHPDIMYMKNTICKKYNNGHCPHTNLACDYLHICVKCKQPHRYINCKHIVMVCPVCKVFMKSKEEYIIHMLDPIHIKRIETVKKILDSPVGTPEPSPISPKHVLNLE